MATLLGSVRLLVAFIDALTVSVPLRVPELYKKLHVQRFGYASFALKN